MVGRGGKSRVGGVGGFTLTASASPVPFLPSPYQGSCVEAGRAWPAFRGEGLPGTVLGSLWAAVGSPRPWGIQRAAEPFPPGARGGTRSRVCGRKNAAAASPPRRHGAQRARAELETAQPALGNLGKLRGVSGAWRGPRSSGGGQRRQLRALAAGGAWGDPSDRSQGDSVPRVLSF